MEMAAGLTGGTACALQAALQLSNEAFAAHAEPACGRSLPGIRNRRRAPQPEMQQLLDAALGQ